MSKSIAKMLKRHRKVTGITQLALAEQLGVEQSTVSRWERGTSTPVGLYLSTLQKLFDGSKGAA